MLQIRHLTVTHKKDLRVLLEDVTFSLQPGDRAAIIGEEGNGKSTLLKLVASPALVEEYALIEGEVQRDAEKFGYLPQEMEEAEKQLSVYAYCCMEEEFLALSQRELAEIARQVGVDTALFYSDQAMGTLSGGEKVKIQLARLLMGKPTILLLDEPSNDLDRATLTWLETFLCACTIPVLYISHDETLLERTANVVLHLERVRRKTQSRCTVARLPYAEYIRQREAGLARQTQLARKQQAEQESRMERYRQIYQRVEHEQNVISRADPGGGRLLKKKMKSIQALGRRFEREQERQVQLPDIEEAMFLQFGETPPLPPGKRVLSLALDGLEAYGRRLCGPVRLEVIGPEKICITGKNGVGKTTLLRQIAQQLQQRSDLKTAYMPQDYEEQLCLAKTPVEFLAPSGRAEEVTRVRTILGSVKYTPEEMERPTAELSGGQKAKLLFVQMVLSGCNVLVLDEPTRNFSPLSNPMIRAILHAFNGAIISVSHDRKFVQEVCEKEYCLSEDGLTLRTPA